MSTSQTVEREAEIPVAPRLAIETPWALETEDVLATLLTSTDGLSSDEVQNRLGTFGPNALPEEEEEPLWQKILQPFREDRLVQTLTVAGLLSGGIGFYYNEPENVQQFFLLIGMVIIMAAIGIATDWQASKALDELKKLQKSFARVIRNNSVIEVESKDLVPGDIVLLQSGDKIPADARVLTYERAELNEALLTGESLPVKKTSAPVAANAALAERTNMVFNGTYVESGTLTVVVTGTGVNTELGTIYAELQQTEETQTPLQIQLEKLGNFLMWGTLIVCTLVVGVYIFRGETILDALITAVALAIAFIPEALGTVITIALALGVREMVKKEAIIKRLRAAEALGSVSVVCTDKTGTITFGEMRASHIWTLGLGVKEINGSVEEFKNEPDANRLFMVGNLCNDFGNPTDRSVGDLAALAGYELSADSRNNRVIELPFTSSRKMMSIGHADQNGNVTLRTKGAPDRLIDRCTHVLNGHTYTQLTEELRQVIRGTVAAFEEKGYRVLAFADRDSVIPNGNNESLEDNLTFIGLVALSDPARPEVRETVRILKEAGITPKMITGDSPRTALAIAKDIGMVDQAATLEEEVMLGTQLDLITANGVDAMTEEELAQVVNTHVFARTSPSNKIDIVRAHQRAGKLVAMTGDGVNDAPSLKQANVGIAMQAGTEITKETADVILTGTYQAIAAAVEVGRTIMLRTRLYSHALLSTNGAEVLLFIVAVLLGWPAPLTAVQLLLINVLGDSALSLALAAEKAEKDVMKQQPRRSDEAIITPYMYGSIALQSLVTTAILAVAYIWAGDYAVANGFNPELTLVLQQSMIFATFMVQKILRSAFTARSLKFNLWQIGLFTNKWTIITAIGTAGLTLAGLYFPIFGMMPLPQDLYYVLSLGLIPPAVEELVKFVRRQRA